MKVRKNAKGFTLAEVLVSLVIFSTAILALIEAGVQNVRAASMLETRQLASIVADNQLLIATHSKRTLSGTQQGIEEIAGVTFSWQIRGEAAPNPKLRRQTVSVGIGGQDRVLVERTVLVPVRNRGAN